MWSLSAAALIPVSASDAAGISVVEAVRRGAIGALIGPSEQPKAWIVTLILTVIIAVGIRAALSWLALFWLAMAAVGAVLPAAVVGNAGQ